jgi:hypothetical protein
MKRKMGKQESGPCMKRKKREWNQCWEVVMEARHWPLHEEEDGVVESMLGGSDGSETLALG